MKTLAIINTVAGLVPLFDKLAADVLPDHQRFSMLDESLLKATIREGHLGVLTQRRLAGMVWSAADAGATAVVVTCSTLGPAVDALQPLCPVPLFRIDHGMAEAACAQGRRIGVAATLPTTLGPTSDLLRRVAAAQGRDCIITDRLATGAFGLLTKGDVEGHDRLVADALEALAQEVDVVVLAQASMARVLPSIKDAMAGVPVLTSPELGMIHIRDALTQS